MCVCRGGRECVPKLLGKRGGEGVPKRGTWMCPWGGVGPLEEGERSVPRGVRRACPEGGGKCILKGGRGVSLEKEGNVSPGEEGGVSFGNGGGVPLGL